MVSATPIPRRAPRRWPWLAAAALVAVVLVVGATLFLTRSSPTDIQRLAKTDPGGARACTMLRDWLDGKTLNPDGTTVNGILIGLAVSGPAASSTDKAIRSTVSGPLMTDDMLALVQANGYTGGQMRAANLGELTAACSGAGVRMPAYVQSPRPAQ